jgi:hypothetical protein
VGGRSRTPIPIWDKIGAQYDVGRSDPCEVRMGVLTAGFRDQLARPADGGTVIVKVVA